eukprot:scaffold19616_cov121-Isochrysis_galbana.AAC.1
MWQLVGASDPPGRHDFVSTVVARAGLAASATRPADVAPWSWNDRLGRASLQAPWRLPLLLPEPGYHHSFNGARSSSVTGAKGAAGGMSAAVAVANTAQ